MGLGVHWIRRVIDSRWDFSTNYVETATVPTFDVMFGVLALRKSDLAIVTEARYHYSLGRLEPALADRAHGILVSVGINR